MKVRPSAIIVKDQAILTLRYRYQSTDVFALPGGNPDPGETLQEALSRELTEELNIKAIAGTMVVCGEVIWREVSRETLHMVFATHITEGIPQINPEQTTALEIVWLPVSELHSRLLYPNFGKHIQQYLSNAVLPGYVGVADQPYIC
ncbi:hypothetical protein DYBT9275_04967 [Dyadobacter sp. CECT 9275]|uniref:Nudix hydrolase domain-containing protein n=1 Tax=Dyadobacter helix TaxID=2822344 RepID=A0A916NDL0_9BACT|nr:NUDIX domain-containing protein [Dyadobacter sp. CECT 9275]CAG5011524.1 hypothetical protein DYBT9275_04967 [Dyadobacter sp. CECT 9275]